YSKNLNILKELFSISIAPENYKHYRKNRNSFSASAFKRFIIRESKRYNIDINVPHGIGGIDAYRKEIERFYKLAKKRDDAFIKNISLYLKDRDKLVVVTGGFHSENLKRLFKRKGYSYITILPKFEFCEDTPYKRLLSGGLIKEESVISDAISNLALPSLFSEIKVIRKSMRDVGRLAWPSEVRRLAVLLKKLSEEGKALVLEINRPNGEFVKRRTIEKARDSEGYVVRDGSTMVDLSEFEGHFEAVEVAISDFGGIKPLTYGAQEELIDEPYKKKYEDPANIIPLRDFDSGRGEDPLPSGEMILELVTRRLSELGPCGVRAAVNLELLYGDRRKKSADGHPIITINGIPSRINLVRVDKESITEERLLPHAGGMGISIPYHEGMSAEEIARCLFHEALSGSIFGDPRVVHELVEEVTVLAIDMSKPDLARELLSGKVRPNIFDRALPGAGWMGVFWRCLVWSVALLAGLKSFAVIKMEEGAILLPAFVKSTAIVVAFYSIIQIVREVYSQWAFTISIRDLSRLSKELSYSDKEKVLAWAREAQRDFREVRAFYKHAEGGVTDAVFDRVSKRVESFRALDLSDVDRKEELYELLRKAFCDWHSNEERLHRFFDIVYRTVMDRLASFLDNLEYVMSRPSLYAGGDILGNPVWLLKKKARSKLPRDYADTSGTTDLQGIEPDEDNSYYEEDEDDLQRFLREESQLEEETPEEQDEMVEFPPVFDYGDYYTILINRISTMPEIFHKREMTGVPKQIADRIARNPEPDPAERAEEMFLNEVQTRARKNLKKRWAIRIGIYENKLGGKAPPYIQPTLRRYSRIIHLVHGIGEIYAVEGMGDNMVIDVTFNRGRKKVSVVASRDLIWGLWRDPDEPIAVVAEQEELLGAFREVRGFDAFMEHHRRIAQDRFHWEEFFLALRVARGLRDIGADILDFHIPLLFLNAARQSSDYREDHMKDITQPEGAIDMHVRFGEDEERYLVRVSRLQLPANEVIDRYYKSEEWVFYCSNIVNQVFDASSENLAFKGFILAINRPAEEFPANQIVQLDPPSTERCVFNLGRPPRVEYHAASPQRGSERERRVRERRRRHKPRRNDPQGEGPTTDRQGIEPASAAILAAQVPFITWLIRNRFAVRKIDKADREKRSFITLSPRYTQAAALSSAAVVSFLCIAGFPDVATSIMSGDREIFATIATAAVLTTTGDFIGKEISGGLKYSRLLRAWRIGTVFLIVGPLLGFACALLITGVGIHFPQTESIFTFVNFMRGWVMFSAGCFLTSTLYSIPIPGFFERRAIRAEFRKQTGEVPAKELEELFEKYSFKNQTLKTLEGINNRWWIGLVNFTYMNMLPLLFTRWHRFIRVVGAVIVGASTRVYVAWKNSRPDVGGSFWSEVTSKPKDIGGTTDLQGIEPGKDDKSETNSEDTFVYLPIVSAFDTLRGAIPIEDDWLIRYIDKGMVGQMGDSLHDILNIF
ncbi:MAG: hypothetical protein V3S04_04765, partial [Candidatus Omnitrophota bacterium]